MSLLPQLEIPDPCDPHGSSFASLQTPATTFLCKCIGLFGGEQTMPLWAAVRQGWWQKLSSRVAPALQLHPMILLHANVRQLRSRGRIEIELEYKLHRMAITQPDGSEMRGLDCDGIDFMKDAIYADFESVLKTNWLSFVELDHFGSKGIKNVILGPVKKVRFFSSFICNVPDTNLSSIFHLDPDNLANARSSLWIDKFGEVAKFPISRHVRF